MIVSGKIKPSIKNYIWGKEIWYEVPTEKEYRAPIFVKKIKTHDKLSVQVHPTNEYALKYENASLGKSEFWLITRTYKDAGIYCGFDKKYERSEIENHIKNGSLASIQKFYPVKAGDVFTVEAGTVHTVGSGIELLEVQQTSYITYRMFDYNRFGANKKKRELHIKKALEVACFDKIEEPVQHKAVQVTDKTASRVICKHREFVVSEYKSIEELEMYLDATPFVIVNFLAGSGSISVGNDTYNYFGGDAFAIDNSKKSYKIKPNINSHIVVSKPGSIE